MFWSSENPRVTVDKELNLPGVTCWAAIFSSGIIGPFFCESTVTSCSYLDLLVNYFWPKVLDRGFENVSNMKVCSLNFIDCNLAREALSSPLLILYFNYESSLAII